MKYITNLLIFLSLLLIIHFSSLNANATDIYSNWITGPTLPHSLASHESVVANGRIYVIGGGDNGTYFTEIYSSSINVDHSSSLWTKKGDLPLPLIWHSAIFANSNLYILGGAKQDPSINNVSTVDNIYRANVNQDGDISTWVTQNNLPKRLARGGVFVYNNRLYHIGGLIRNADSANESVVDNVYMSSLGANGDLGSWIQLSPLPQPRAEFGVFQFQNRVFIAGGMQPNSSPANSFYMGIINELTGDITWSVESNIPTGLRRPAFTQLGNKFFFNRRI